MDFVITLIADTSRLKLPQVFADSMAHMLMMQDVRIDRREWLADDTALDFYASDKDLPTLHGRVQEAIRGYAFDAIVQPAQGRRKKLLIADMESTIVTCECLDELAEFVNLREKIEAITARAMNGEIDFKAALRERVALLEGLDVTALQQVMDEKVKLMPGARPLVATMKANGAHTMLVSGGFDFFANQVQEQTGFAEIRANTLEIANEKLTGKVKEPILDKDAKRKALEEACATHGIDMKDTLAVGDGANDVPMLLAAGLGVAYHAKPAVKAQLSAHVSHADLTALLYAQGYKKTDFA